MPADATDGEHGGPDFLASGGEMAAKMRAHDWAATPLGAPASWPQRLRSIVNVLLTSRFAMWMGWGPDLTFFYNDAYAPTLGIKHGWALGRPSREVWAEIWPDVGPRIASVLATGQATWDEALLLFLERSGYREETYHTFSYSPLRDDAGSVAGHLCVVTEDTERVIGQRRLATLSLLSAGIADATSTGHMLQAVERSLAQNDRDLPFTLLYLWDGTEAGSLSVPPAARLAASSGFGAAPPPEPSQWPSAALWSGAARVPIAAIDALTLPSGAWQQPPSAALAVPIARQGQERPAGFLVVGLNPHRHLDDAYGDFIALIAGQIASGLGNARAYEEERRRAEALAALDRAKTDFFSNVSHEFRTPLTLMLNPVAALLDAPADALPMAARGQLELVHRNALRLLRLVNSLLDFSRIEAGRAQARYAPTDLAALTADLASIFRSATDRAGLALHIDAHPLPEPVYLDADMWEKVVLNLLSNAFKFTFEGTIRVGVGLSADQSAAEMTVADTGIGIADAELPLLFERFHRVADARGRSFEGSGIGLALVQELVRLHGGTVTASSVVGRGSTFTVRLPFGTAHLPAERVLAGAAEAGAVPGRGDAFLAEALRWLPDVPPAAAPAAAPSVRIAGGRVLLADDNADMRAYLTRLLTGAGLAVEAVADGAAALARARVLPPDLVLTDVMMPALDGFGLLRALRQDPRTRAIPVILLSARAGEEARVEGLGAGADDYLTKPFNARELLARVDANLQLAGLRRAAAQRILDQNRVLETIATGAGLERALSEVALLVQAAEPQARCALMIVGEDGHHCEVSVGPGLPDEYHAALRGASIRPPYLGPCGEAIDRGHTVAIADLEANDDYAPAYRALAHRAGLRAVRSTPIRDVRGHPVGSIAVYYEQPRDPSPADPALIGAAGHLAAIALTRDRAERALRAGEERLRALNASLEELVAQRTGELEDANRQLLLQIEERERIEVTLRQMQRLEAVGQLTSGVAHDFNNLLTVVLGQLQFVAREVSDPSTTRRLAMIESAAQRGARLTAQLLAFARRQRLNPKVTDLNEVMRGLEPLLRSTLGGTIRIEMALAQDIWPALVDQTQLELVVLNLAINARDAMPKGGTLVIATTNASPETGRTPQDPVAGDYVVVSVRDSGTGMETGVLERAFEPFFTTKEPGKGSGLGLAQVYGFAKQSGGGVGIETQPGQGTRVLVYLPRALARIERPAPAVLEPAARRGGGEAVPLVLLVDDDTDVREVTRLMLADLGYAVVEAASAAAALTMLEATPGIGVVIADFAMPGVTGADLARVIEARRPDMPVLIVTGYADQRALGQIGARPVLSKPFRAEDLGATLRTALEGAAAIGLA